MTLNSQLSTLNFPWEQQPRESDKAFAAFSVYLSQGPERSLAKTAEKLGRSKLLMERWSSRHDWPARVAAYNAHMALVEREAAEALVRELSLSPAKGRGPGRGVLSKPPSETSPAPLHHSLSQPSTIWQLSTLNSQLSTIWQLSTLNSQLSTIWQLSTLISQLSTIWQLR